MNNKNYMNLYGRLIPSSVRYGVSEKTHQPWIRLYMQLQQGRVKVLFHGEVTKKVKKLVQKRELEYFTIRGTLTAEDTDVWCRGHEILKN